MKLTDLKIRNLKPRSRAYRINDSSGLVLEVTPHGNKIWVMCCSIADKIAREIILGEYPACSLTEARQWHKIYCAGIDKLSIQNYTLNQPTHVSELDEVKLKILHLLSIGLERKQVVHKLNLHYNNISYHLRGARRALKARSNIQAVVIAIKNGLISS